MRKHTWWWGGLMWTAALALLAACDDGSSGGDGDGDGGAGGGAPPVITHVERADLLLVVDNSRGMGVKHQVLAETIPYLVARLTNPLCLEAGLPAPQQPTTGTEPCPAGTRQFEPITDLHIGVISSSIGGHGSENCTTPDMDDKAHLLTRMADGGTVSTYENLGFLAWDPLAQLEPPGEGSDAALTASLQDLVAGVGETGCGYEAQLESMYRFLVDPNPYDTIELGSAGAQLVGTDAVLLTQRRDFLRPDSLLLAMVLSDENDCSIRDGSSYYIVAQTTAYHLPKARPMCAQDPGHECCRSCGQPPACDGPCDPSFSNMICPDLDSEACDPPVTLPDNEDKVNLRCWDQKRRFGIDFLYPMDRYVTGFTSSTVTDSSGDLVPNPLYTDLTPDDEITAIRDPGMVFFVSIVGVPWQDIARKNQDGSPDLLAGLDADGLAVGGVQTGAELAANGTWDLILGDPANYVKPQDPLMHESVVPRGGTNPVSGDAVADPLADAMANPMNGHEYYADALTIGDLQYACIFPMPEPRDCLDSNWVACDCPRCDCAQPSCQDSFPGDMCDVNNPVCQDAAGTYGSTQLYDNAYPGIRELHLAKSLSSQAVVGSICPAQLDDSTAADYGYGPVVSTLAESIAARLAPAP